MGIVDDLQIDENGEIKLAAHTFSAVVYLVANRIITAEDGIVMAGLSPESAQDFQKMMNYINTLTDVEKLAIHGKVESLNILVELGKLDLGTYISLLGIGSPK